MKNLKIQKVFLISLSILIIFSFFLGFFFEENSAGAGGINGDLKNTWKNLNTFINYDLINGLKFVAEGNRDFYVSSRTPLLYILNSIINPFTYSLNAFLKSIFFFSLIGYFLFLYAVIQIHKNIDKTLLILLSCILILSPYYRTSAYWGAEENYGVISTIITFLFYNKYLLNKKNYFLYLTIIFSSLCVYMDQKLLIIPFLVFLKLILNNELKNQLKIKIFFTYFILSIPFIYLIFSWKSIIPTGDSIVRKVGVKIFLHHPIFVSTIIAFYLFPLLIFKKNLTLQIKKFLKNKLYHTLLFMFFVYAVLLIYFDLLNLSSPGMGVIHKLVILSTKNFLLQKILILFFSIVSFSIILLYVQNNFYGNLFFFFLLITSFFIYPIYQEYYDPLILITIILFIYEKNIINLNTKNILIFTGYFLFFLFIAILYYFKIFKN